VKAHLCPPVSFFGGCPNKAIGGPSLFKGPIIGTSSYFGVDNKSLLVASMRVSGYFNRGIWPQFSINILNVAFIPIVFSPIAFLSATMAVYRH
jgi:hypothetical protein